MTNLFQFFGQKWVVVLLLLINIPGTIYGYIWYETQLAQTPTRFLLFVPDSPTASLFFVFVLFAYLLNCRWPLMEAFAAVTLIKYGIWAVAMNLAGGFAGDSLNWVNYMLIFSHAGMAIQAVLYAPFYRIKPWHLVVVAIWTLHNDIIDYVFHMHPWVSHRLVSDIDVIGYFTFWLSIFSLLIVYLMGVRKNRLTLDLQ
ncbi:DUF1405 domain-containing protein [Halalkalibacter akibai]|uniref:Hypothetical transmembrane protein CDS_ID OB1773 n=1 Tax=Halalkalibacter akibai (strain ATCC 43226 / DSM 21942 / CIP 109018 / JCM 9157 / 1139) TaxID=1236973 RepID=W4QR65_HALA3|nr:DUF1405 domain-containing protein [Halalkalibacter akibai]GAE34576.1 hypothetical transmembrane protein CDS_ID OB1773 [Halalkalibacter akibai JCM 9157]